MPANLVPGEPAGVASADADADGGGSADAADADGDGLADVAAGRQDENRDDRCRDHAVPRHCVRPSS